jgi:hypothetical protein
MYERNIEAISRNHFCRRKTITITYSKCVSVALVIQHAKHMRRIILSSVLSYKRHDFRKSVTENKICFDFLITFV